MHCTGPDQKPSQPQSNRLRSPAHLRFFPPQCAALSSAPGAPPSPPPCVSCALACPNSRSVAANSYTPKDSIPQLLNPKTLNPLAQCAQLKRIRAERQRREEMLALAELRASVAALRQVDAGAAEQHEQVRGAP